MINYVIYETTSGKITKMVQFESMETFSQDTIDINVLPGEEVLQADADPKLNMVVNGAVVNRPLLSSAMTWNKTTIIANGTDSCTFGSTLPNPTPVTVIADAPAKALGAEPELSILVDDGSFTFATFVPGKYVVEIQATFPYLAYTQEITAT